MQNDIEEEKRINEEIFTKIYLLIYQEWLEESYSNLECGLPFIKANSTVNLMLFGKDITELWIRENRDFIVPVSVCTCPVFLDLATYRVS